MFSRETSIEDTYMWEKLILFQGTYWQIGNPFSRLETKIHIAVLTLKYVSQ